MKKKMLIINTALAPYMIDQYNDLNRLFEVEVVFLFTNVTNQNFNQRKLLSLLECKYSFLLKGLVLNERVFRFGLLNVVRGFNPDFICAYEFSITTQYILFLKQLGVIHSKIGSTIDDSLEICNHVQTKIRKFARQYSVKKLDFIVVLSHAVSCFYKDEFYLSDNKVIVSPILQNSERLRKDTESLEILANDYLLKYNLKAKKIILFTGRFVSEKGLTRFINSINTSLVENKEVVLVLVGEGQEREEIETIITDKRLSENILLPGRFEGLELYAWYICASGFVLPSIYEPYGAVVNESLIFGTKVLCSKYAGSSDLIHSDTGLIFDPLDEKQTIDKFNLFLNSIEKTEIIDLANKKSLMANHEIEFNNEWNKILTE